MDLSEISKSFGAYAEILKITAKNLRKIKPSFEDSRCKIFQVNGYEISLYSNGDLFIRPCESENLGDVEIKKTKFTYKPKYMDPLSKKSPFGVVSSNVTTPTNEESRVSPRNGDNKWKLGNKESLEVSHRIETIISNFTL